MDHPWLKDTIQYDPYEEPDYPQPEEAPTDLPKYRTPSIEKAVRVYTVAQESRYLMIRNIPPSNVINELIQRLALYGTIQEYDIVTDLPSAPFTQTVWVKYELISSARLAKYKLNKSSFFGQDLWVQYAPEYETREDVQQKLDSRRIAVLQRLEELKVERPDSEIHKPKRANHLFAKVETPEYTEREEPRPAGDFVFVPQKQIIQQQIREETKQADETAGQNKQPLKRRKPLPGFSEKPVGALREGEEEEKESNRVMQKVADKLNSIERAVEKEMQKPAPKKRRRI